MWKYLLHFSWLLCVCCSGVREAKLPSEDREKATCCLILSLSLFSSFILFDYTFFVSLLSLPPSFSRLKHRLSLVSSHHHHLSPSLSSFISSSCFLFFLFPDSSHLSLSSSPLIILFFLSLLFLSICLSLDIREIMIHRERRRRQASVIC